MTWTSVPHGADLDRALGLYGPAPAGLPWLDLSTGINPQGWDVRGALADMAPTLWRDLPTPSREHLAAFERYHGAGAWPVAGSQAVIQALPRVWRRLHGPARVQVQAPGYGEHAARWALEGHDVQRTATAALGDADVIVVANPNNPTGEVLGLDRLAGLARQCRLLVVDEAFADAQAERPPSMAGRDGVLVLRSLGKFFGLAGLRCGAVLAPGGLRQALQAELGPWSVPGPVLALACAAMSDAAWQARAREALALRSAQLARVLEARGLSSTGTPLFRTAATAQARAWHEGLARLGVWTRLFELEAAVGGVSYQAVRFGLPPDDHAMRRLAQALASVGRNL